jgi:hypothetical protein
VVLHISEAQFREIMALRKNVYELVAYLNQERIAHFLAHPLYAQNDKLTVEIIEKCLLLFFTFEIGTAAGPAGSTILPPDTGGP